MEEALTAFCLSDFRGVGEAITESLIDGSVMVVTPQGQWQYAVIFPLKVEVLTKLDNSTPVVFKIQVVVKSGKIGIGCTDESMQSYVSNEAYLTPDDGEATVKLFAEAVGNCRYLIVRNVAEGGVKSSAIVRNLNTYRADELNIGERRELMAQRYSYWHYEHDLGYGVSTKPNNPEIVKWHSLRRKIIFDLIEQRYGQSLAGKHCLDVACCSGFWSFALTERNPASVLGLDKNAEYIEQARFVQECSENPAHKKVVFRHQDLFELETPPNAFDLVLCLGVMYHLTDIVGAAKRIFRATREVAIIDSSVSDKNGLVLEFADSEKYCFCGDNEFAFVPTRPALIRILEYAGFSKVTPWLPGAEEATRKYGPGKLRVLLIAEK